MEVVALAVYLLGGDTAAIDTEDVAVKANQLAPGRFIWRKHADQINLELVRVYLSDAKKPEKGQLLDGSGRKGWTLTPAGRRWASGAVKEVADQDLTRSRGESRAGSIDERRWRRERGRIQTTSAWAHWVGGERKIPYREAAEVFRIDSYSVGQIRSLKLNRLLSLFEEDTELGPFLVNLAGVVQEEGEQHNGRE